MENILIGVHTSISGGIYNAVKEQKEKGGNCGQIFSHSPQSWSDPNVSDDEIKKFNKLCDDMDIKPWVIHASYLVNLCTPKDDLGKKSKNSIQSELDIASKLNIPYVNVHLGAHTGAGVDEGLKNAAHRIDELDVPKDVELVIESDAGGGTRIGDDVEHLSRIQELTETHLRFCIDTAHIWAAGYEISTRNGVERTLNQFDEFVGLEDLAIIHLNDSKYDCGTNRDEHQHLGDGEIGKEGIKQFIIRSGKLGIPIIAETPITDEKNDKDNINFVKETWENC